MLPLLPKAKLSLCKEATTQHSATTLDTVEGRTKEIITRLDLETWRCYLKEEEEEEEGGQGRALSHSDTTLFSLKNNNQKISRASERDWWSFVLRLLPLALVYRHVDSWSFLSLRDSARPSVRVITYRHPYTHTQYLLLLFVYSTLFLSTRTQPPLSSSPLLLRGNGGGRLKKGSSISPPLLFLYSQHCLP